MINETGRQAAEKLQTLLTYVEQVVRLDERPAFRLPEHRLPTGQAFALHQHELHSLPGLRHDVVDEDGPIWLSLQRLARSAPPTPPADVVEWVDVSPDPDREPTLRDFLIRTVSKAERLTLVEAGSAREEDCVPARLGKDPGEPRFDVRLRLEDRPAIALAAQAWISQAWLPWAVAERPVRRSLSLYQRLFEVAQLAELGGGSVPFELVWGIGSSRWIREAQEFDLPLIERLVDIEIDEAAGAQIKIRPRMVPATVNLLPFENVGIDGVTLALDAARRALTGVDVNDGVSPFRRDTYEPALRACQARLDAEGAYLPDRQTLPPGQGLPPATEHLTVSDRWVLFARRRSDSFILADIEKLKRSVEEKAERNELPRPACTLVMGPADAPSDSVWRPLDAQIGSLGHGSAPTEPAQAETDLFFPKPFNDDQIEIVRRLEHTDGIVVQGPPGTGKTHTISNLICHCMATGRRVLVVSHGEPALAVLRNHLPDGVRDLAISIGATEREGLKQLETAVRMLQSVVESLKPSEQKRKIRDLEAAVLGLRAHLAEIDCEIERFATTQTTPVRGERPADLARRIAANAGRFAWFNDRPQRFRADTNISDADIASLRAARLTLATRLEHLGATLPAIEDLPDGETLARIHDDLVRAQDFAKAAARPGAPAVRITSPAAIAQALRAAAALQVLGILRASVSAHPWLERLADETLGDGAARGAHLFQEFLNDALPVFDERDRYVARPDHLPKEAVGQTEIAGIVARLANSEPVFGFFAFRERALKPFIDAVRVSAQPPTTPEDWAHVRDHLHWRARVSSLETRWQALADEAGAPPVTSRKELGHWVALLKAVLKDGAAARRELNEAFAAVVPGAEPASRLWHDPVRLDATENVLRNAAAAAQLAAAQAEVNRLKGLLPINGGRIAALTHSFLERAVGNAAFEREKVGRLWSDLRQEIGDLQSHRASFATVERTTALIDHAGAPDWARRLRSEPAREKSDPLLPSDWHGAWDWAAGASYLAGINDRARLQTLSSDRVRLDGELKKKFESLVRERTFYALASSMTGRVRMALSMFATALRRTGKGTGKGAARHRRDAREAMEQCYAAIPCWIMPAWRVAEQLPSEVGSFDLVIMDEASQSDIRDLPALLRGKKILVVGDDKQVSPSAAFIENAKLDRLEHNFLKGQPFKTLLLPGSSLYDLAKVMFPEKIVMLKEHFRCVEPIIRFSMQFYPEPLVPLRVPTAQDRLDPPLLDIYVRDGRRTGDKQNFREAEVIVGEIAKLVSDQALARIFSEDRFRSIGVVSLIGAKQAALINRMLLDELGEEVYLRHRIACGDSATFQVNERDVIFLSMVADPSSKLSQTATQFEQRFNVALSRARDRMVLVRSVTEEELKPDDLKARVIRHFRDPMAGVASGTGDLEARCESDFERDVLRRLVQRGYSVTPQVGSAGYRIDLVVEGTKGRRLAVECDGDKYHGPERWNEDIRRQRILERVGWRFWRCWASSFTIDPDGCMADLFDILSKAGIEPVGSPAQSGGYTLHIIIDPPRAAGAPGQLTGALKGHQERPDPETGNRHGPIGHLIPSPGTIRVGDRVVIRYLDDHKQATFTLSTARNDLTNGFLSVSSPLGQRLIGSSEEDELEFEAGGRLRRVLVLKTERVPTADVS